MRRMNSMLLGHHGAFGPHQLMYLRIASRACGSSQESGRWTMRVGTSMSSAAGRSPRSRRSSAEAGASAASAAVEMDLQRADAGRQVEDAGKLVPRCTACISACTRKRSSRSSDIGAVFDQHVAVALRGDRRPAGPSSRRRRTIAADRASSTPTGAMPRPATGRPARSRPRGSARVSPGLSWPIFHSSVRSRRADEAAEARTVRAEDDRHVAGEVHGADRIGVVVDVRGMQAGFAAVGARPSGFGPIRRTPVRALL